MSNVSYNRDNKSEPTPDAGGLRGDIGCLCFVTLSAASGELRRRVIVPLQRRRLRLRTRPDRGASPPDSDHRRVR